MNFRNTEIDGKDRQVDLSTPSTSAELSHQPSIFSLTFDEFQSTLGGSGKDFGSMNMEELLKSIWSAEESQMMATAGATGLPESDGSGLPRQGSLTLPRTISLKTVDEVWRDLSLRENTGVGNGQEASFVDLQTQQRQPTLGEMTLEEFLEKAGITREQAPLLESSVISGADNDIGSNPTNSMFYRNFTGTTSTSSIGLSLGFPSINRNNVHKQIQRNPLADMVADTARSSFTPLHFGNNELRCQHGVQGRREMGIGESVMNNGLLSSGVDFGVAATISPANPTSDRFGTRKIDDDLSHLPPVPYVFNKVSKKGGIEKAVERRQKRMIKNRESAAKSRARKQAYTIELEAEVTKLKEQNQALQKKQELLEVEKNQALEIINQQCGSKKISLRRTRTGPCKKANPRFPAMGLKELERTAQALYLLRNQ